MNPKALFHTGLYLALQQARRRPIGTHIRTLRKWEKLDRQSFDRLTRLRLDQMLRHAKDKVPLYVMEAWRQADPADISSWPIMDREAVLSSLPLLRSRISYPGAVCRQSSASSGTRLQMIYDPQAAAWSWANEYRAMLWHGLSPGVDGIMIVHDMFGTKRRSRLQDFIMNKRSHLANCITPASLDEMAHSICRHPPKLCWGLPSAVFQLVRHMAARYGGKLPRIPFVKMGGEQVYPFQRHEIQNRLGAKVFATYGCTEVGAIGAECKYGSMHIFSENVHLEVMKEGRAVLPGERGDLVVTTLANRAMPLIRCQIGDQGRISSERCGCGLPHPVLRDLRGKTRDTMVAANGNPIPAFHLEIGLQQLFSSFPPKTLRQVLFEQRSRRAWKIYAESPDGFGDDLASGLKAIVRRLMGDDCLIEIERVPFIPREDSGKFRYFRGNITPAGPKCIHLRPPSGRQPGDNNPAQSGRFGLSIR